MYIYLFIFKKENEVEESRKSRKEEKKEGK
jgi:hypothetical protein